MISPGNLIRLKMRWRPQIDINYNKIDNKKRHITQAQYLLNIKHFYSV